MSHFINRNWRKLKFVFGESDQFYLEASATLSPSGECRSRGVEVREGERREGGRISSPGVKHPTYSGRYLRRQSHHEFHHYFALPRVI